MRTNDILLGLVKLHPEISGYELRKIIDRSTQYFMDTQLSQIYPALKHMTGRGLLTYSEETTDGGRVTKRYRITDAGEAELLESLRKPMEYAPSMSAMRKCLLRVAFIGLLPHAEQVSFLEDALAGFRELGSTYNERISQTLEYLDKGLASSSRIEDYWEQEYAFILQTNDRLVAWLEELLANVRRSA